jgi:hypothetical protein
MNSINVISLKKCDQHPDPVNLRLGLQAPPRIFGAAWLVKIFYQTTVTPNIHAYYNNFRRRRQKKIVNIFESIA